MWNDLSTVLLFCKCLKVYQEAKQNNPLKLTEIVDVWFMLSERNTRFQSWKTAIQWHSRQPYIQRRNRHSLGLGQLLRDRRGFQETSHLYCLGWKLKGALMLLNSEGPRVSLLRHCSHTTTVDTYKKATLYFTFYAACTNPSVHQSRIFSYKIRCWATKG